jgi:hypothetical protein
LLAADVANHRRLEKEMAMRTRTVVVGAVAIVSMALLSVAGGCAGESGRATDAVSGEESIGAMAKLRIIHASADAPAVDIQLQHAGAPAQQAPRLESLAYGAASNYLELAPGQYQIQIRPQGAEAASPAIFTQTIQIEAGQKISAIAAGLLGATRSEEQFRILIVDEDFQQVRPDQALVRVIHAGADAPAVDIDVNADGSVEIPSLQRFTATGAAGIGIPAGESLQVALRSGGAIVTAFTLPALQPADQVLLIATGKIADLPRLQSGFGLLAVAQRGVIGLVKQNPVIFALNASPSAPSVDIRAGQQTVIASLEFGVLSAPIQIMPGSHDFEVYVAGTEQRLSAMQLSGIEAGQRYLVVGSGNVGSKVHQQLQVMAYAEQFELGEMQHARVRIIHASPDAPAIDIGTVQAGALSATLYERLSFLESSVPEGLMLEAQQLAIGFAATGTLSAISTFELNLRPGQRLFAVAAGALSPEGEEKPFRVILIDTSVYPWQATEIMASSAAQVSQPAQGQPEQGQAQVSQPAQGQAQVSQPDQGQAAQVSQPQQGQAQQRVVQN